MTDELIKTVALRDLTAKWRATAMKQRDTSHRLDAEKRFGDSLLFDVRSDCWSAAADELEETMIKALQEVYPLLCQHCNAVRPCDEHDRPEGTGIVPYAHPRDEMRYQILRVGAEYFRFVRDEAHMIRQFNSYDEAVEEVKGALMKAEADGEYVIVTVHRCFKHTTTYPKVDPIHEIKEYGLSEV